MGKLISKLKNRASYKQPYRGITITDAEADEFIRLLEQEQERDIDGIIEAVREWVSDPARFINNSDNCEKELRDLINP